MGWLNFDILGRSVPSLKSLASPKAAWTRRAFTSRSLKRQGQEGVQTHLTRWAMLEATHVTALPSGLRGPKCPMPRKVEPKPPRQPTGTGRKKEA